MSYISKSLKRTLLYVIYKIKMFDLSNTPSLLLSCNPNQGRSRKAKAGKRKLKKIDKICLTISRKEVLDHL